MPEIVKAWEVQSGKLVQLQEQSAPFQEAELEKWLFESGDIFGEDLLILNRQMKMPDGGRLDLLCMDSTGHIVIVELKRDIGTREAIAQALDYASWIDLTSVDALLNIWSEHHQEDLATAFDQKFDKSLPDDWNCESPRLILVCVGIDEATKRMVEFLAKRYKVNVGAVMFNHAQTSDGKTILFRSVVAAPRIIEQIIEPSANRKWRPEDLLSYANQHETRVLVDVCRKISAIWWEESVGTSGGSFRYWAKLSENSFRMVFGVNASGELANPPQGQLDVWIRTDKLAQITGITDEQIKDRLAGIPAQPPFQAGMMKFILRLKTEQEAEKLIAELKLLASSKK